MSEQDQEPKTWRVRDVMRILNITRETTLKLLATGQLRGFKAGARWRIRHEDLEAFMRRPPAPKPEDTPPDEPMSEAQKFAAWLNPELDPLICLALTQLEKMEDYIHRLSSPRPMEA